MGHPARVGEKEVEVHEKTQARSQDSQGAGKTQEEEKAEEDG